MAKTPKTLSEIKMYYARKASQLDVINRNIIREITIATEEMKRFQKAKLRATQHRNDADKYELQMIKSASELAKCVERMSRFTEPDGIGEGELNLNDEKIIEFKRRETGK